MTVVIMRRAGCVGECDGGCAQRNRMGGGGRAEKKRGFGRSVREGAAFRKRRRTYLTLQPCHREQNTEESRG